VYQRAIDFSLIGDAIINATQSYLVFASRSKTLCEFSTKAVTLSTVACGCTGGGSDSCFTADPVPVAVGRPCSGATSIISTSFASLSFASTSIRDACVDIQVSQVFAETFKGQPAATLSGNFATFKQNEAYVVINNNRAAVGIILGDGIEVSASSSVQSVLICISATRNSEAYEVYDFAATNANRSVVTILGLDIDITDGQVCSIVSDISGTTTYLPVKRLKNHENAKLVLYRVWELAIIYTLACLFILTSIYALYKIAVVLYARFKFARLFRISHLLLVFLFLFNFIRGVYFFLVPLGFSSIVADYILVVLPTFFYFTGFTIIVSLWAVVCLQPMIKSNLSFEKIVNRLTLGINIVLYVFFILIVLLFQFLTPGPPDNCQGRLSVTIDISIPRALALVYAIVIAIISFMVGLLFIIFGSKLFFELNTNSSKSLSRKTRLQQQTFIITLACSIAFILHCVFIVVLSALTKPNLIYSFIGLIVTEIAPSLILLFVSESLKESTGATAKSTTSSAEPKSIEPIEQDGDDEEELPERTPSKLQPELPSDTDEQRNDDLPI